MQGIMQATRLYNMTDDPGVREMLRFNIARDTMHQNMWLAALEELRADGLETLPVPAQHPFDERNLDHAYEFQNMSEHVQSAEGRWAAGLAPDGHLTERRSRGRRYPRDAPVATTLRALPA
jgi:manganese catalase